MVYFKRIFLIFGIIFSCFFITCGACASEITYDIYHHPQKLHIILQFTGSKDGITKINIPSNIWGHDLSKQIKNIQILDKTIIQKDPDILSHKPNQIIELSYDVINVDLPRKENFFYTQCENEGFFFLHDFALIYPQLGDQEDVILKYHSHKTNEFFCFSEEVQIGKKITTSLKELKGGLSIAGNDIILQSTKLHNNMPVLGFNISRSNFINLQKILSAIVESQKSLCNCQVKDNAFIFIGNKSNNKSYRGTLFKNNLMLFLIPNIIDDLKIKNLIAHENFHKFIGTGPIRQDPKDEQSLKWFFEGFTDYFSLKTNLIRKNITLCEYLYTYNEVLKRYFTSQYRSLAFDEASSKYWQNREIKQMIYDRGHIMAQELDLEIKRVSDKTLQDVLCELLRVSQKDTKLTFSKNLFIKAIKTVTNKDLTLKINGLIDGNFNLANILSNVQIESNKSSIVELFMVPQYSIKNIIR
jgi:hypothetical protein